MKAGTPQTCPRCGSANECALAAGGSSAAECWCADVAMDPERTAAFRDKAQCLCRACSGARNRIDSRS